MTFVIASRFSIIIKIAVSFAYRVECFENRFKYKSIPTLAMADCKIELRLLMDSLPSDPKWRVIRVKSIKKPNEITIFFPFNSLRSFKFRISSSIQIWRRTVALMNKKKQYNLRSTKIIFVILKSEACWRINSELFWWRRELRIHRRVGLSHWVRYWHKYCLIYVQSWHLVSSRDYN